MTLLLALACASASGSSPKGNDADDDDAPAGFVEVDCYACTDGFCFELAEPAPVVAWLGIDGRSWRLAPDDGTVVGLMDGIAYVNPKATSGWTECVAFVAE